ncbi:tetratricopeptide repeat protein [Striga asiatica]|uniref:Tetratricopeptide repeat protein n=1 Tax=Striga asiatica TaxID=4170 RepID=A0A5A7PSW3_STRAF|nr:tetratricopeptide repeat protein [Striga asiatica]
MPEFSLIDEGDPTRAPHYLPHKEIFEEKSPRSPLSTHSPPQSTENDSLDLAVDDIIAATSSIDQLYHNICEMQSSDHSPSRRSFLSYGEESRIDSELRFLAGGNYINEKSGPDENIKAHSPNTVGPAKGPTGKPPKVGLKKPTGPAHLSTTKKKKKEDYLGPYLLKQARDMMMVGAGDGNFEKALELARRAAKSFEAGPNSKPNLDLVMCLHVISALYCQLGRHAEAIPILERSIEILPAVVDSCSPEHALAKFAGCMQLGDTYAMLGQIETSISFYKSGLEIQREALGEKDPRFAETCRYLAEAHVQAIQFDEAEKLCLSALEIHKQKNGASPEEAADRRLLGLICESRGDYETALEHYVLAGMSMAAKGQNADVAAIDCSIGDAYLSLARYDEAVFAYQKALNTFKSSKGESHPSVAMVFVRLADLYNKIGKFSESKSYCENAIRIYSKPLNGVPPEEIASGLVDISAIFESLNEPEKALELLRKAVNLYGNAPGQQGIIAGIEAQMGVLYYILGSYSESYESLRSAVQKFRAIGEKKKSAIFGIALNQMGLSCVQIFAINEAADLFEEARDILEAECGPYHADTLGVYSNLAGTYDAMGRTCDAIEILEYVVELREERLGTANPDVDDEKRRLAELLKEAGLVRRRKSRSLETLLDKHNITAPPFDIQGS